jgi:hypothetical protein
MAFDMWEQLAETPIPPAPETPAFDRGIAERINARLFWLHVVEFAVRTIPYALAHFMGGVLGFLTISLTGKYPERPRDAEDKP